MQPDLHSFAVSAVVVFFVADRTRLIKWLVTDSDIAAEIELSTALPALTDEGYYFKTAKK